MSKKSLVLLLVLVTMLSAVLTGCAGNYNNANVEPTNEVVENNTATEEEAVEEKQADLEEMAKANPAINRGNILTVGMSSMEGVFNPILVDSKYDMNVVDAVFNGLVKVNENAENVPDLATWDVSDDKLTYTFHITEGVKFHNGRELTSADVEFTYYAIADPDYDGSRWTDVADIVGATAYRVGEADAIEGIKVIDDYTISFTIKAKNVSKASDFTSGIMSKDYYAYETFEDIKDLNDAPMGTGPMVFDIFEVGQYVQFTTNENYFEGRPNIDGVIYKVIPDAIAAAAVNAGDVDIAEVSPNLENYDTITESGIAEVQEYLGNTYRYIGFNLRLPKFQDKETRQALFYGLNLAEFIDAQWEGFAAPCLSPISPTSWAYPDASTLTDYSYNPEKAAALLAEAGWEDTDNDGFLDRDGEKFTIEWTSYNDYDWPSNLISVAKENWGALGIEVEGNLMEFAAVLELVYDKQDFEIYNMGWSLSADPDPTQIFGSESDVLGGHNSIGFHHERANEIFALGNKEYDQAKRAELYQEWAKIANEELPYLFISIGIKIEGVNTRVHNLELGTFNEVMMQIMDIELDYID